MSSDASRAARKQGQSALLDAFTRYRGEGLRLPPVPRELADRLIRFGEWRWGTDDVRLEDHAGFLEAARAPTGFPEVAFGHTGHGVSSWWLCYRLRLDAVAIYGRFAYGGAYGDAETATLRANQFAAAAETLVPAATAAKKAGRLRGGHRLIVVDDRKRRGFWQVAGGPREMTLSADPLGDALAYLAEPLADDE